MRRILILICLACFFKAEAQNPSALSIADSLYAVGNYSQAISNYQRISPKNSDIYHKIARANQAKGNLGDALINYAEASSNSENTIARNEYGKLLITTSNYKAADSIFTLLIGAYKNNPNFYYQRGRAKMQLPDTLTSVNADSLTIENTSSFNYITDFEKAVALDSTHQKALYQTAKYYLQRKDYPLVERLCKKALESYPDNVEIISLLAQDNLARGFMRDAIPLFEKLLELGQNSQFIHEKLGMAYYKIRNYDRAIEHYQKGLDFSDEDFKNAEKHGQLAILFKNLPLDGDYYTLGNTYK
ncbi:MAG: tetratricopeptide repeat protein, partial [Leeuwenhoekiella sp.]